MNTCFKCGCRYEPTWIQFNGQARKPSGRLVIECGREKISKTLDLCPACTDLALEWVEKQPQENAVAPGDEHE